MNLSIQQSFFGRNYQHRNINPFLKRFIRRNASAIIQFCQKYAKRIKPRHQYQSILFPRGYEDEPSEEISQELINHYHKEASYPFYLSRCNLFIDNHHLKIMRKANPIPIKFDSLGCGRLDWFAEMVQEKQKDFLIGVTSQNWVLIISLVQRNFNKYMIPDSSSRSNKEIVSLNCHKSYIFIFCADQFHILENKNGLKRGSKLDLVYAKQNNFKIHKGYGIEYNGKFYIFHISQNKAKILISQEGILSKIDFKEVVLYQTVYQSNFINFSLNLKDNLVTFLVATRQEVNILNYHLKNQTINILFRKQNGFNRWSQLFCMPYLDFIQRQNYLLAVLGLRQRLYFVKISAETIQISRRIKFNSNVQYVSEIGRFPGLVIILKGYEKCKKIILTHQNKLVSYNQPINLEMVDYYSIEQQVQTNQNCRNRLYKRIDLYKQKEIHFINTSGIQRIVISKWQDIYNQMKETQNIKLLKVLILLKHVQSPFLKSPSSFQMLQSFFPTYNSLTKQILLEYYQIMNLTPQKINIIQNPILIIPFILQHKIRNLPEELQNKIMQWCLEKDERLVQEMIIGGSECGWQFAIKRGWIRAFKAMVRSGMQIEMPILKLYSMALLQRKKIVNQATQEETQILSAQGHSFLNQLIQYVIFVFTYCLTDLQGEENIIELKQIVSLVFKNQLWTFLVKFQPLPGITLLTHLFAKQNCIQHINHSFELQDITGFNKIFRPLLKTNYSNAETIFSHLSCIFNELHPQMVLQMIKQHSKFMLLKYHYLKENPLPSHSDFNVDTITLIYQILNNRHFQKLGVFDLLRRYRKKYEIQYYFSFKKEYLKQMLKMLIRDSSILDNMYRDLSTMKLTHLLELSEEQIEEDMNDFLVFIWIEIYILILESLQRKQPEEIRKYSKEEIVGFLSEIQEQNYKFQYLGLHIMQSINYMNQDYSLKIFQKYFKCNNQLLKSRIFLWLNKTLYSLPVNSNNRINLQEQIIRKLKDLIEIDKEESRMILQQFFQDRQKEIIKKIDNNPALQLEYVQLIINKGRDGQHIQNYYTNLHIKLILQLKPQNLIDIFNKNRQFADYNIADALAMTQASDNFDQKLDILIFLYEKDGQITKCIDTYLQKLQELALSFIKNLQKHKEIDNLFEQLDESINLSFNEYLSTYLPQLNQIILYFTTKFQQSIKLIYRQVQVKYEFIKIYLNKLVQILVYILSENFKFKNDYIKFISSSIGNFIFKMRENNCLHFLSQWPRDYPGRFQFFTHVQPYFIQVFNKVQIQTIVTNKVSDIQRKTLVKQIKETLKLMEFSITSVGICPVCQQPLNLQSITVEALLFGCGHIYHKTCIQPIGGQDFCFFCVSKNQYKSMIQNPKLDLVQLLKSYRQMRRRMSSPRLNLEIKLKDTLDGLNKKKMNRLGLFDKKVSTIQSQAEIIDLKLLIEQYYANQNKK